MIRPGGADATTCLAFEQALAAHRVRINPVLEFGSREAVCMAVERGVGVVSDIEFIPHPNLVALPIRGCREYSAVNSPASADKASSTISRIARSE